MSVRAPTLYSFFADCHSRQRGDFPHAIAGYPRHTSSAAIRYPTLATKNVTPHVCKLQQKISGA